MTASKRTFAFIKTAACPASATLLSYRSESLSVEMTLDVKKHLEGCDFCSAELPLLAHHQPATGALRVPELPMDLRILAESILGQTSKVRG